MADINLIRENLNTYVVRPLNAFGLGGFVFDIEGDINVNLQSEITDHYIETNVAVQDHIAIKPLEITLNNYVGELVYNKEGNSPNVLQEVTTKLTTIANYLPQLSKAATQAKQFLTQDLNTSFKEFSRTNVTSAANTAADLWALSKNVNPAASNQQKAYLFFKALLQQKILVSVQTPFEFATNMAVMSIQANQPEASKYISNFSITLKQIRTVSTQEVPFDIGAYEGRAKVQNQETANKGKTQGSSANSSILFDLKESLYGGVN